MDSNKEINNRVKNKPFSVTRFVFSIVITSVVLTFLFLMAMPNYPPLRASRIKDDCFLEIRLLAGAVEMYNLDYETKIQKLDNETIKVLVDGKYLKNFPEPFIEKCKYLSQGDLASDTGVIYCEAHGDPEGNIKSKYPESDIIREVNTKIKVNKIKGYSIVISIIILISLFAVSFFDIILPKINDRMTKLISPIFSKKQ